MLILGAKKEPQRIVLRAAVEPRKAVRKAGKIVTPASDGEPEAYVVMAPITSAMMRRAARVVARVFGTATPADQMDIDELFDRTDLGSRELIRLGLTEWGGLGDDDGNALELTPDYDTRRATATDEARPTGTIDLLLGVDEIVNAINDQYVRPDSLRRAEKNASPGSPNGTLAAATPGKTTAGSRAARKTKTRAASNARTASTSSRPKRPSKPGKS